MKIEFSKSVEFTPVWRGNDKLPEGERMEVTLQPLEYGDLLFMQESMKDAKDDSVDASQIVRLSSRIIPKYVTVRNLSDSNGPVDSRGITVYPIYMGLCTELLLKLSSISVPTDGDEKNSAAPLA